MRCADLIASRYRLLQQVGIGGMGAVWCADDLEAGTLVALKVLRDPDRGDIARFLHEAEILAKLDHPHIVRHIGHGLAESSEPYLAMEWLDGQELRERLLRGPLSLDESLGITSRIAAALAVAHSHGIVHRDIKPSNLYLVGDDPRRVKLLDFGIARLSKNTVPLTSPNTILGTPGYLSPEQASGEGPIGPAADIFSLGCVLFECLTGQPAFQGAHPMALLAKLLLETAPRLIDVRPQTPPLVSALVERMLAKHPSQRIADGMALVAALAALDMEAPLSYGQSPPSAAPSRIGRGERRHLSLVAIASPSAATRPDAETILIHANAVTTHGPRETSGGRSIADAARKLGLPLGAQVDVLADGTTLLVFVDGQPSEQAARAGRLSLALMAMFPRSPVVLVSGRSDLTDRLPVGEVVERAAFLLQRAIASQTPEVIADEETLALLGERFETASRGRFIALVRECLVESETRTVLGKPSPFVGRERELGNLLEALEEAFEERRSRAFLVTGPPGMGKSRLRQELFARLRLRVPNTLITLGRADSLGEGAAFSLIASSLRQVMGVEAGLTLEWRQKAIRKAVAEVLAGDALGRVSAFLGEVLDAPFPDDYHALLRMARSKPAVMAAEIQAAYLDYLRALAQQQPLLLSFEDLHGSDASSVKLIDTVLRELRDERLAVIAFARPRVHEVFPRVWAERGAEEIRLGPLARRSAMVLVRAVLEEKVESTRMEQILDRAEGNAFYLEELVRLIKEGRGEELPVTVLGMVEARLSALPADARRLLRAASVFGEVFWKKGVLALFGRDRPAHFDDTLKNLVEREILTKRTSSRFAGEDEFSFRHALVREAAYSMLTDRDRAVGHGLAGAWLEAVGERDPAVLAMHFERGGLDARAAALHAKSAERAMRGYDLAAALTAVERGLGRARSESQVAAELWALRARIESIAGNVDQSLAAAEEAIRLARRGSIAHCLALEAAIASAMFLGRTDIVRSYTAQLPSIEPDIDAVSALARMLTPACVAFSSMGRKNEAKTQLDRLRTMMAGRMDREPAGAGSLCYASACWNHFIMRRPYAALQQARDAIRHLERAGEGHLVTIVRSVNAGFLAALGAGDDATGGLEDILSKARKGSLVTYVASWQLARVKLEGGKAGEARALTQALLDEWNEQSDNVIATHARITHVEACVMLRDDEAAENSIRVLIGMASAIPMAEAMAWFGEAKLRVAQNKSEEAVDAAYAALAICEKIEVAPLEDMLAVQAEALVQSGDKEAARIAIVEAMKEIKNRAALIDDSAYRKSYLERVPANRKIAELWERWGGGG